MWIIYFIFTAFLFHSTAAARMLVILPSAAVDYHKFYRPVVRKLAESHELVVVTSQPMNFQSPNMTVYELAALRKIWDHGAKGLIGQYALPYLHRLTDLHVEMVKYILAASDVQSAFDASQHYDLVVVEYFGHTPLYALARRFNCPLIGLAPNDEIDHEAVGNMWNYFQYPHPGLHIVGQVGPVRGTYAVWAQLYKRWFIDAPANAARDKLIKTYFGHQIATSWDLAQEVDLIIMDSPPSLNFARPIVPVTQQLGWFHMEPPTPLPREVETYLNESKHGVIYINFNSEFFSKPTVVSLEMVVMHLTAIRATSYDILCNWDDQLTPPVKGVKYIRGVSQQSILNHTKVILFVAEPTVRNMEEAVWYKTPMLSLVHAVERTINDGHVEWSKIGAALFYWDMKEKNILWKTTEILTSRKYKRDITRFSKIAKELSAPLNTTDWWIGYVLRHNGTKYLKYRRGKDFNFFQYYMIDIFVTFGAIVVVSVLLLCLIAYIIYRKSAIVQQLVRMLWNKILSFVYRLPYRVEVVKENLKQE